MARDTATRKWQLTINNPVDRGFTHDRIKAIMKESAGLLYWCMADEIGEEGTYHTHVYVQYKNAVMFSTMKKRFDGAHFEMAKGTAKENMEYVSKTGKWLKDKKHETSVPDTFEQFGELPMERQGKRNDLGDLYAMIKDGFSNYEILEQMPESLLNIDRIEMARQTVLQETYKKIWRDVNVTYIYGFTGLGKTRAIMEQYGYENVYRVTDYAHPFDSYKGQDVVIFEEFRTSIRLPMMLTLLEGYPVELLCRYANKMACFTKVCIITNVSLGEQYVGEQIDSYGDWLAFLRRINLIRHYTHDGIQDSRLEITRDGFRSVLEGEVIPFENPKGTTYGNAV